MDANESPRSAEAPGSGGPVQHSTLVDAIYSYDSRDLQDMADPYSGVHVPGPPVDSLVRINIGKDHDLISSGELRAIEVLAYGARRVQIEGQTHNVGFVVRHLREYLAEVARAEARQADQDRVLWASQWGAA